ncbi:phosphotransferase [Legionella hackeliae]|uniref:Aminoglycoside phosphotransferase n=1 Tax=Legionella hackeliae TaxID=449 RepID=A0A0A8UTU7_LEGHA|nr:phosphotransferase [Legionella hackeliae]KTD12399.1 putative aminoglycoside phosphotransferase [Legionella hackeliae]CEK10174.1 Aminoglycoside phosphotransferase [Legionella hackeliae]STX46898.1 aminoglycoside phosphotransferase [Legionella hackeliae]
MLKKNKIIQIEEFWELKINRSTLACLSGGDINKSYFVNTSTGKYIIKHINILQYIKSYRTNKVETLQSLSFVETVAKVQKENVVSAVEGKKGFFLEDDNQIFILYPFKDGRVVVNDEIQVPMVSQIANKLHEIHNSSKSYDKKFAQDKGERYYTIAKQLIFSRWWELINKFSKSLHLFPRLNHISHFLITNQGLFLQALEAMSINKLCHNDLKPKNVLWSKNKDHFWILDWEAASEFDYRADYLDTLIAWSVECAKDKLSFNTEKVHVFQETYGLIREELELSIYIVLVKWYFWLAFCLSKCLRQPPQAFNQIPFIKEAITYIEFIIDKKELTMLR